MDHQSRLGAREVSKVCACKADKEDDIFGIDMYTVVLVRY